MISTGQLFRCTQCSRVDMRDLVDSAVLRGGKRTGGLVCTKCRTGSWHGQFPYMLYNPATDDVVNPLIPPSKS